jgi:predicted RNA binding protein with dsRBD fold (UPF0201 family)
LGNSKRIEETIGTGLPTLLAKNFKLVDFELPAIGQRIEADTESLSRLRELFGNSRIIVTARDDQTFLVKAPGGTIILKA